jgi:hypothetical protein
VSARLVRGLRIVRSYQRKRERVEFEPGGDAAAATADGRGSTGGGENARRWHAYVQEPD